MLGRRTYAATNWTELSATATQAGFGVLNRPQEYAFESTRKGLTGFDSAVAEVFAIVYPGDWTPVSH